MLNPAYQSILMLHYMLEAAKIPHELRRIFDGWQVVYIVNGRCVADAIEHEYSYGVKEDLLELSGLLTEEESKFDTVKGYLSAQEVFDRIQRHWWDVKSREGTGDMDGKES